MGHAKSLKPQPPEWAVWSGLPAPTEEENFDDYVTRLGMDPDSLTDGLTAVTICIANQRLATELMRKLPDQFEAYVAARRRSWWPQSRVLDKEE